MTVTHYSPVMRVLLVLAVTLLSSLCFARDFTLHKKGMTITNEFVDLKEQRVKLDVVILVYTYGFQTSRYNMTEKIFKHYRNVQEVFKEYAEFSFTIVGSEGDLSRALTMKYFSEDSYFEARPDYPWNEDFSQDRKCDVVTHKIQFGMKTAYHKSPAADILFWVGSSDYICFNFWKQVIEGYNPNRLMVYGIDNFLNGENAIFYTNYDGKEMKNRNNVETFWHNGMQPQDRQRFAFVGSVIGITTAAIRVYPHILNNWNCDEGKVEDSALRMGKGILQPLHPIVKFSSKHCFIMNVRMEQKYHIVEPHSLHDLMEGNGQLLRSSMMSSKFLEVFDQEFAYFRDVCSL